MAVSKPINFKDLEVGMKVKRNGLVYYVVNITVDARGGYVEIKPVIKQSVDAYGKSELWNSDAFNRRNFFRVKEPEVVIKRIEDIVDGD